MKNGLYILSIPSGYYPYVMIGWVEVEGLELKVNNARIIRRFGNSQALAGLAKTGPAADTELLQASPYELVWRAMVSRTIPAEVEPWESHCPKPDDWN